MRDKSNVSGSAGTAWVWRCKQKIASAWYPGVPIEKLREHPFSTYAHRGGGGLAKSVRSTMSLLVTVTSFCVRGGRGLKKAEILRTY